MMNDLSNKNLFLNSILYQNLIKNYYNQKNVMKTFYLNNKNIHSKCNFLYIYIILIKK